MRLFSATIATETNTFSPMPTSLDYYRESVFFRPGEHPTDAPRMCTAPLFVARRRAAAVVHHGASPVENGSLNFHAPIAARLPSGRQPPSMG